LSVTARRDDEAFAYIARCDVADRETIFDHEEHWPKSLPALGITFPIENIRGEVNTSRVLLSTRLSVARLFLASRSARPTSGLRKRHGRPYRAR